MHLRRTTWLICLSYLEILVIAKGLAGCYERIYMCEAYMLLNTIEGNTQNWILPIPTQRGGSPRQASGPANTFTFKECIDAVSNVSPPRCQVEAPDPTNKRTVEQVANELKAAGYVNE